MRGVGVLGAEGPDGLHPRANLLAFARLVVEEIPERLVERLISRLEALAQEAMEEARDRRRGIEARDLATTVAVGHQRAANALRRESRARRERPAPVRR